MTRGRVEAAVEELRGAKQELQHLENEAFKAKEQSRVRAAEVEEACKRLFAAKDWIAEETERATDLSPRGPQ
jgi:hypothetical protein